MGGDIALWKILDIGYITSLYFSIGYLTSIYINKIVGPFNEKKANATPTWLLFVEVLLHVYFTGLVIFAIKKVVIRIPSPFHGLDGFNHNTFSELHSSFVLTFVVLFFQKSLKHKLEYMSTRITGI